MLLQGDVRTNSMEQNPSQSYVTQ